MAVTDFTIDIHSANDLQKGYRKIRAVVSIAGDLRNGNKETEVAKDGTNPKWESHPIEFTDLKAPLLDKSLNILLVSNSKRTFLRDKTIGEAKIPLQKLLDWMGGGDARKKQIEYVQRVQPEGTINFRYTFGNKFWVPEPQNNSHEPLMAHPVGHPGSSFGYPPASHAGAYSYPPPGAYPAPPYQQSGYGYAPPPQAGYVHPPQPGHGHPVYPLQQVVQAGLLFADLMNDMVQMAAYEAGLDDAGFGG